MADPVEMEWSVEFPHEGREINGSISGGYTGEVVVTLEVIAPDEGVWEITAWEWNGASNFIHQRLEPGSNVLSFRAEIPERLVVDISGPQEAEVDAQFPTAPTVVEYVDDRNWTNVFDVGPCRVELQDWGETVPPERYSDWGIESIEVIDGEIVVTSVEGGSVQSVQIVVIPEYDTGSYPVRVIGQRWQFNNGYGYNMVHEMVLKRGEDSLWDTVVYPEQGEGFPDAAVNPDPAELSRGGVAWDTVMLGGSSG